MLLIYNKLLSLSTLMLHSLHPKQLEYNCQRMRRTAFNFPASFKAESPTRLCIEYQLN